VIYVSIVFGHKLVDRSKLLLAGPTMTDTKVGLLFENYKSFGEGLVGFDSIAATNVIIGRNNSGKSALLDLVEWACAPGDFPRHLWHAGKAPRVKLRTTVTEHQVGAVFQRNTSGGPLRGNHWDIGKSLVGAEIEVEISGRDQPTLLKLHREIEGQLITGNINEQYQKLGSLTENPLKGKIFRRLSAERDIGPESVSGQLQIAKNGAGLTNTVAQILNRFEHPTSLVSQHVLAALNEIFTPDARFDSISVQQYGEGAWEIFLTERDKGTIALSHSGSGLKTILLVIGFFILLPHIHGSSLSQFVFAFEELENNLHPALQRRLMRYVTENAQKEQTLVFITTHSNVVIDMFGHDRNAQIIHVTHSNGNSQARRAQTYVDNRGVLDDLDVRASDLLQANVVVWLEGPSDRLYFNRWIELLTDGEIKESTHYQCVFYGGRLLAHLSASDPSVEADEVVKILRVNKNAILLIDSDKKNADAEINSTKKRLIDETTAFGGLAWISAGREIENYLPLSALQSRSPGSHLPLGQFEDIAEYLERTESGAGKKFERKKVLFAESMLSTLTRESFGECLDLDSRLLEVTSRIKAWNGLS
jgi:putative ATP-dependent endonuclease of the OLD family